MPVRDFVAGVLFLTKVSEDRSSFLAGETSHVASPSQRSVFDCGHTSGQPKEHYRGVGADVKRSS
jgi:hypothetical protein